MNIAREEKWPVARWIVTAIGLAALVIASALLA